MREFLKEGDLIVCEIKNINLNDKSINLHIRHNKFGLLKKGILIEVNSCLVKRMKS